MQLVREHGGIPLERPQADVDLIIIGADHQPDIDPLSLLDEEIRNRCTQGLITVVTETELWQSLGLVEQTQMVCSALHASPMMAELLDILNSKSPKMAEPAIAEPCSRRASITLFRSRASSSRSSNRQLVRAWCKPEGHPTIERRASREQRSFRYLEHRARHRRRKANC